MARAKKIFCVIAYDICNDKRRAKIVKILDKYGARINLSVYECMFTAATFQKVKDGILAKIDIKEDTVAYYPICVDCYTRIVYQTKKTRDIQRVVMV